MILERQLIFVTGKGGVGKTTVAAALASAAAERGRRAIVAEVGSRRRVPDMFGRSAEDGEPVELRPGLSATSIDPDETLRDWLEAQLRSRALAGLLARTPAFAYFAAAAPGAREMLTLTKAWDLLQPRQRHGRGPGYDLVVLDAPASGHGIGMLGTPRTFEDIARVGPIRRQAEQVRELISDPGRTAYLAVALPEEMPVTETIELEGRLRDEIGVPLDRVVANGLLPQRFTAAELERVAAERANGRRPALRHALDAAAGQARRARVQQAQLRRLRRGVRAPVATLPLLFEPELRAAEVERLAGELERRL